MTRVATIACIALTAAGASGCGADRLLFRLHLDLECGLGNRDACDALTELGFNEVGSVRGPQNVRATALPDGGVAIDFDQPAIGAGVIRVTVFREVDGTVGRLSAVDVSDGTRRTLHRTIVDPRPVRGSLNRYVLVAADPVTGHESGPVLVSVDVPAAAAPAPPPPAPVAPVPPSGYDTTAPAAPRNVVLTRNGYGISIVWDANAEPDLKGYLVERRNEQGVQQPAGTEMLTPEPITQTSYHDALPIYGYADRHYRISAVDTAGNRSEPAEVTFDASPGERRGASARAAAVRRDVDLRLDGRLVRRGALDRTRGRLVEHGARASGTWAFTVRRGAPRSQRALLGPLAKGTWKASLDLALAPTFRLGTARGPLLLRTAGGHRLCASLDGAASFTGGGLRPAGTLTVLGGTGPLRTLHGTLKLAGGTTSRAPATARLRTGRARGLPAACRALR